MVQLIFGVDIMPRKSFILVILSLLLISAVLPAAAQDAVIRQWASFATASSEYTDDAWNAMQATGAPDSRSCVDAATAWASLTISEPDETLTVFFDTAVFPTQINIHQNYNPGAITGVELIAFGDGDPLPVNNTADPGTPCPGVLTIDIDWDDPVAIEGVVIHLDQTLVGDWNEIDAVELVGIDAGIDGPTVSSGQNTATGYEIVGSSGMSVTCEDGRRFDNGIEVRVIQMRSGFNYTATALGLDGFDPILAVLDANGNGLCTDDDSTAANYSAWLPTTGEVAPSNVNSQITFANTSRNAFADISLVVGGFNNAMGEFVLILEGMALTSADGAGDPFAMQITPGMIASGVTPSVYMISVTSRFDPLIVLIDSDYNFIQDDNKNFFACDDAGDSGSCWGESFSMRGSYVSRTFGRQLPGGQLDAMLQLPVVPGNEWSFYNFLMRSAEMRTFGDYMVVFHLGIGA